VESRLLCKYHVEWHVLIRIASNGCLCGVMILTEVDWYKTCHPTHQIQARGSLTTIYTARLSTIDLFDYTVGQ